MGLPVILLRGEIVDFFWRSKYKVLRKKLTYVYCKLVPYQVLASQISGQKICGQFYYQTVVRYTLLRKLQLWCSIRPIFMVLLLGTFTVQCPWVSFFCFSRPESFGEEGGQTFNRGPGGGQHCHQRSFKPLVILHINTTRLHVMFVTRGWWYSFLPRINFFTSFAEQCQLQQSAYGSGAGYSKTTDSSRFSILALHPPPLPPLVRMKCWKCCRHFILDRLCFRLPSELSSIIHNGCSSYPVSGPAAGCPSEQITGKFNTNYNNFRYTWSLSIRIRWIRH